VSIVDSRWNEAWFAEHEIDRMIATAVASAGAPDPGGDGGRGQRGQMDARAHHDVWDRLPAITCPTLVAAGRYDGIAPVANGRAIVSRVPGAELRIYEGGHVFFVQDPTAIPEIVAFLLG
jgi:3-oxoadipate enol-lactonase